MSAVVLLDVSRPAPAPHRPYARSEQPGWVSFAALAGLYFAIGWLLLMRYNLFDPDSTSRVANAGYVLESRDPHLSAIGFVWNPLPSLVEIPIVQLARWWPELRTHGLASVVQSAVFMAAAALMVGRIAADRGIRTFWRRVAVGAFALQPMIVVYGASGMSEAAETFALLWCVRRLMRWTDSRSPGDLSCAGLALGVGYLARYEVAPAAVGAVVFVGLATLGTSAHARIPKAMANMAIILFPIAVTAAVWALCGWVVNQELFATLSSRYGNDSIVESAIRRGLPTASETAGEWLSIAARMLGMQPFTGIACGAAIVHSALSRRVTAVVPAAIFAPVLALAAWGQLSSTTFGCFRYYLLGIPLVICTALALWTPSAWTRGEPRATFPRGLGAVLLCASIVVGYPVTVIASLDERIGNQPLQFGFNSLLFPGRFSPEGPEHVWYRQLMIGERVLAGYLDRMHLPDGAVLMDTFNTWGVWLSSEHPRQFVITSDYDFKAAVNRPWEHNVQYLLVSSPAISDSDALNVRYPTLWNDGAGMSRLVYAIDGAGDEERFRLFRITGPPRRVGQLSRASS